MKAALVLMAAVLVLSFAKDSTAPPHFGPSYTDGDELKFPSQYREWVFLSSGFDMSYSPAAQTGGQHVFDNVFANPEAYQSFVQTGTWPDKTMLVLEVRGAEGRGSINQKGSFQSSVKGLEVHVKDQARFGDKWAFFSFDTGKASKMIPTTADCYSCHAAHGAVDNTFVQFYPTLLPIAKSKSTLSSTYRQEIGATKSPPR